MIRIFFFFPLLLQALIIQTNRMEDLLSLVDEKTWTLFDIDDTLLESQNQYGRAKWYWWEFQQLKNQGMDDRGAHGILYPHWIRAQEHCHIQPMEPTLAETVAKIQKIATYVLGITARHPPICPATLKQLDSIDIDFSNSSPEEVASVPQALYKKGIWFLTDYNQKGVSVRKWVGALAEKPSKIVFIDDSRHHLENMEWELSDCGIEYIGVHYTKAHERPFVPEIAKIQAQYFPKIITDEEAALMIH